MYLVPEFEADPRQLEPGHYSLSTPIQILFQIRGQTPHWDAFPPSRTRPDTLSVLIVPSDSLADLKEVAIRIPEKTPDLPAPIDWWR